jgi:hypothetical protein
MRKLNEQKQRKRKINTVRPAGFEKPEGHQLHHNHEKFLFLTVLLLFAECEMYYW